MFATFFGNHTAAWSAGNKTKLQEIWLIVIFNRSGFVASEGGNSRESNWVVAVVLLHEAKHIAVGRVETKVIDFHEIQRTLGDFCVDDAIAIDVGIVANTLENAVGDAWGKAGAGGEELGSIGLDFGIQNSGGASNDLLYLWLFVILKAVNDTKAVAEWTSEGASTSGGADDSEMR